MSANGSPLAVFGGARATFGIDDGADAVPVIQVALQGGEEVDLSNAEDAAGLSSDAREEARDKIQGLQVKPLQLLYSPSLSLVITKCARTARKIQDQLQVLLQALEKPSSLEKPS